MSATRRETLLAACALTTAGAAWAASPRRDPAAAVSEPLAALIPSRMGSWRGDDDTRLVPATVGAQPRDEQTVERRYESAEREPIMFVATYNRPSSPALKVHRPETCYLVAGFAVSALTPMLLPISGGFRIPSVAFTAVRGERREHVLYWTRVAGAFPQTLFSQRLDLFRSALHGVRPDGLLVRLSVLEPSVLPAMAAMTEFCEALTAACSADGRRLLFGSRLDQAAAVAAPAIG